MKSLRIVIKIVLLVYNSMCMNLEKLSCLDNNGIPKDYLLLIKYPKKVGE